MTPKEAADRMRQIDEDEDTESGHMMADDLFCEILKSLGYDEAVDIFDNMDKWYA